MLIHFLLYQLEDLVDLGGFVFFVCLEFCCYTQVHALNLLNVQSDCLVKVGYL
jgi:hypothetical protein